MDKATFPFGIYLCRSTSRTRNSYASVACHRKYFCILIKCIHALMYSFYLISTKFIKTSGLPSIRSSSSFVFTHLILKSAFCIVLAYGLSVFLLITQFIHPCHYFFSKGVLRVVLPWAHQYLFICTSQSPFVVKVTIIFSNFIFPLKG